MKKERKKGDRREWLKTRTVACNHATSYAKKPKGFNQSQASKYNSIRITPELKMNLNRWINLTSSGRVNDNTPITTSILPHTSTIKILRLLELKKGVLEAHIQNDNRFFFFVTKPAYMWITNHFSLNVYCGFTCFIRGLVLVY